MEQTYLECLAKLGVGGAHPGGLQLSRQLLLKENLQEEMSILDAGCGTGQTAAYIAQHYPCRVFALDNNERMVKKCKQRMVEAGLSVDVLQANAESLPYADNSFDMILAESVIAFTDVGRTIKEFRRILKPGGCLLAIEISKHELLQNDEEEMICDFYGFTKLLTSDSWCKEFRDVGFLEIKTTEYGVSFTKSQLEYAPDFRFDDDVESECFDMLSEHEYLTRSYQNELSYHIFRCI